MPGAEAARQSALLALLSLSGVALLLTVISAHRVLSAVLVGPGHKTRATRLLARSPSLSAPPASLARFLPPSLARSSLAPSLLCSRSF